MVKFSFKKPASSATTETAAKAPSAASGQVLHFFANFFNYFVVCLCFVVLAAGFWFIILPKYRFVQSNQQVVDEEAVYKQKLSYLKQLNEIKTLYATVSDDDKQKIDQVLSAGQNTDSLQIALLREISYIVKINGGTVETPQVQVLDNSVGKFLSLNQEKGTVASAENLEIIDISLTISKVNYEQFKRIVTRWERSLRLLDVVKLEFDPALSRAKVEMYAYHLKK